MSWASSEGVRRSMKSNRGKDTKLEIRVRQALHARGLRYRLQRKVPGSNRRTMDIAFARQKVAVFIDGCFWHGCPVHHTVSKTNPEFWATKVKRNRERDRDTDRMLAEAGWFAARFWEHQSTEEIVDCIVALVSVEQRREPNREPSFRDSERYRPPRTRPLDAADELGSRGPSLGGAGPAPGDHSNLLMDGLDSALKPQPFS